MEASLGDNIASKVAAQYSEARRAQEEELAELERNHQRQLEQVNVRAQQEAEAARKESEEHTRRSLEAAERQHMLERKLRQQLAELKGAGGGPVLRVRVLRAEHLPKVDSVGWIDAYVMLKVGDDVHKTSIKKNNKSPEWNEDFAFPIADLAGALEVPLLPLRVGVLLMLFLVVCVCVCV
jgi:hypothetical protein